MTDRDLRVRADVQRGDHAGGQYEPEGQVKEIH
jgi:hypothetical protein